MCQFHGKLYEEIDNMDIVTSDTGHAINREAIRSSN